MTAIVAGAVLALGAVLGAFLLSRIRRASAQNRLLSALVDSSPDAIASLDSFGRVTSWNAGAERLFGYSRDEMIGKPWDILVPAESLNTFHSNLEAIKNRTGQVESSDTLRVARDGRRIEVSLSAFPVVGGGTAVSGAIIRDLTEQKRAERMLHETEQRLQALLDNSPNLIYLKDRDGRYIMVNRRLAALLEREAGQIIGKTVYDLYPKEAADSFAEGDREILETGVPYEREERIVFPHGERVTINNKFAVRDADGSVEFICGIATDVTARRLAEDELHELQWRLQAILDNAFTSIYLKDAEGRLLLINEEYEKLFRLPASEILGKRVEEFIDPGTASRFTAHDREVLEMNVPVTHEVSILAPDGEHVVLSNKFPLRGKDGVTYLGGISLDITDLKRTEKALAAATTAADAANRAKSEFLSRMSHELRTPLNVILGFGQLLQLDELRQDQVEALGHIINAGHHLLDLINDALDISRVESGRVSLSLEPTDLAAACRETTELLQPLADPHHIEIAQPELDGGTAWVTADRQRLKQILMNLVSNAIKYNHDGGTVLIDWVTREAGIVRCRVSDTGPGIAEEMSGRLFTPFDRLGAEASGIEGTGLGLALSKRLVEAMGGVIGFEKRAGGGTTFWIDLLPATSPGSDESETAGAAQASPPGPAEARVIVYIEDNLANIDLMEFLLGRWSNVTVIPAMQGRLGLDLARQHRPDLVLLDMNLPDLGGEDVLRELKSDSATRDIPVIIASADASASRIERLKAAGAAEYFTKPFNVPELLRTIARELEKPRSRPSETTER